MNLLIIISIIIFIVCIILIFLLNQNNNIHETNYKIDVSFEELNKCLVIKIDILDRLINIIERELKKDNKTFKKFKSLKSNKLDEFEIDILLSDTSNLIFTIKNDNSKLSKVKSFDGLINELKEIENKLVALRTYYNKYTGKYNNIINRKSYKLLALIKKYKSKKLFNGQELKEKTII